ncbi:MAG: response regulator [Alphaproteobacteria bacterium]|nr:response regulator [Alphaproteobacteria bacterium]MBV9692057.1 response regulator [Alphaproteobacteria bacterium]
MSSAPNGASPKRIFVAEDEFLVFLALEDDLKGRGYEVVGPFTTVAKARAAAAGEDVDLALLDINMGGEMAYPLADDFAAKGVPFIFLSGYDADSLPERYRDAQRIAKPYDPRILIANVQRILEGEETA